MQLTSEVEAIMNGSVVRKEGAVDKAIGVSTINLQPNENGIVPLSSQSSFKLETPAVAPSQAPKDTLEEVPIAVAATDNMGTFNIPSPETPLVSEELPAEEKVDVPLNIDMPQMPETVLAEEPTSINNSMFATTPVESQEVKSAEVQTPEVTPEVVPQAPVAPTPEPVSTPVAPASVLAGNIVAPQAEEQVVTNSESNASDVSVPELTSELPSVGENKLQVSKEYIADVIKFTDDLIERINKFKVEMNEKLNNISLEEPKQESVQEPVAETTPVPQVTETPVTETIPVAATTEVTPEPVSPAIPVLEEIPLDTPAVAQTETVPTVELPVVETSTPAAVPATPELASQAPVAPENVSLPTLEEIIPTETSSATVEAAPQQPAAVPVLENPIAQSAVATPTTEEVLMKDAMDQIANMEIPSIDSTPIQGGKFF